MTDRSSEQIGIVGRYMRAGALRYDEALTDKIGYSRVIEVDLSSVSTCVAGPRRSKDLIELDKLPEAFEKQLVARWEIRVSGCERARPTSWLTSILRGSRRR